MKISVVIPTYNEERTIEQNIQHLIRTADQKENLEIIIADHSEDQTREIAANQGVHVVWCDDKGRGAQMNEGASLATGDIYYFLHCDTLTPEHWDQQIRLKIEEGFPGGCFQMEFDWDHWFLKLSAYFTRFNFLVCRGGDQSLFITKQLFDELGPYETALMEDMELISKIMRRSKFGIIPAYVVTSARRYKVNGVFYLQFHFAFLHLLRALGVDKGNLKKYYTKFIQ